MMGPARPLGPGHAMGRPDAADGKDWVRAEPALGAALYALIRRTVRRGLASWFVWVPLATVLALLLARHSMHRRFFEATVVLQLTEGSSAARDEQLGAGAVRAHVHDRAFTSERLLKIMSRHPRQFSDAATEPAEAVEDMRKAIDVTITDNDFVEDRGPDDPPRSARIAITYHAADPELAVTIARELAEAVVSSTLSIQQRLLARDRAAAAAAVNQAERAYDSERLRAEAPDTDSSGLAPEGDMLAEVARQQLRRTVALAAQATLASRAGVEQKLRVDVIDMGRAPAAHTTSYFLGQLGGNLAVALLIALFLAGTFDPRVLGRDDLEVLGLVALGELPALPQVSRPETSA